MTPSRRFLITTIGTIALSAVPRSALAQKSGGAGTRAALAIGNGHYQSAPTLSNPPNDARAVAAALERLGFTTELLIDGNRADLFEAIRRLGDRARGAEAALLFYAGHAVELGGHNLVLPVSVTVRGGAAGIEREGVPYDVVSAALEGRARTTLIILDSCRNSPFSQVILTEARSRAGAGASEGTRSLGSVGLASVDSTAGTLIAFATAPGHVALDGQGQHSPFTEALLEHLETPDVEIRDMLTRVRRSVLQSTHGQQVPWDNSSLEAPFFMRTGATANRSAGPTRRIVEEAAAHGIPLPASITEERFRRPVGDAGPAAMFVGSWSSGDRRWGAKSGRRNVLIVLSVDESRGTADAIFAQSEYSDDVVPGRGPGAGSAEGYFRRRLMSVGRSTAVLEWTAPDGGLMQFSLAAPDTLTAVMKGGGVRPNARTGEAVVRVQMRRID